MLSFITILSKPDHLKNISMLWTVLFAVIVICMLVFVRMNTDKEGFIILTVLQIPSVFCAIYIFSQSVQQTSALRRLQNHLLICLLITATWTILIDLPNTQKYLWSGSVTIYSSWFCVIWNISFFFSSALNRSLMAFMSVQRHFLVFRPHFYHTHRSRLLFHYIPLILIVFVIFVYLFITNIFISCSQMSFSYSDFMCGYTCSVLLKDTGTIYTWLYVFLPTTTTVIGCILLPIRFVIQKRRLQHMQWNRARKMIVQMSLIAGIYSICWLPYTIILQLVVNNVLSPSHLYISRFLAYVPYITPLMTPFIVFYIIRDRTNLTIVEQIKHRFFSQRQTVIRPAFVVVAQQENLVTIKE